MVTEVSNAGYQKFLQVLCMPKGQADLCFRPRMGQYLVYIFFSLQAQ